MRTFLLLAATPLFLAAFPASAGERTVTVAIANGAYAEAEAALNAALRNNPDLPELLLNLAAVYAKTGRQEAARAIYAKVLKQRNVFMDLPSGNVRDSHAIALAGLKQIAPVQFTSR